MKKTILISGCCGFLGSHLCDFFLKKNFKVIGLDNLLTGLIKNIKDLKPKSNFKFINHDIINYFEIKDKIDYILHFASPASPVCCTEYFVLVSVMVFVSLVIAIYYPYLNPASF